jgi:hypothetical protein
MPIRAVEPIAVSISTFSAMTDLGRTTAYNLIAQGKLKKIKVLGRTLITVASIEALLAEAASDREVV